MQPLRMQCTFLQDAGGAALPCMRAWGDEVSDYMQEAKRLIDELGRCRWAAGTHDGNGAFGQADICDRGADRARAALLAHIERGRVPDAVEAKDADEALAAVMEQAQVFASAWSLIGGVFDGGNALQVAEEAKSELEVMIRSLAMLAAAPAASDHSAATVPMPEANLFGPAGTGEYFHGCTLDRVRQYGADLYATGYLLGYRDGQFSAQAGHRPLNPWETGDPGVWIKTAGDTKGGA